MTFDSLSKLSQRYFLNIFFLQLEGILKGVST